MAKIKLVDNKTNTLQDRIDAVCKRTYNTKVQARRVATEAGVQEYVSAKVVKAKAKK